MIVLKVSTEKVLTMNLKYEEKEQKVNRIFSLVNNLQCFSNEYIQQRELIVETFLLLSVHSDVSLGLRDLKKRQTSIEIRKLSLFSPNNSPLAAYSVTK